MIALCYFALAYGCLVATAATTPRALTSFIKYETIIASKSAATVASSTDITAFQDTNTGENETAHALIDSVARDRFPAKTYNEYGLSICVSDCVDTLAADPTPISVQASIGNTTLMEVRFFQCNGAYVRCHQTCLDTHKIDMGEWPPADSMGRPFLTSNVLRNCVIAANAVAQLDRSRVAGQIQITAKEFEKYNTVGMCNRNIVEDAMICLEKYTNQTALWDLENNPWK